MKPPFAYYGGKTTIASTIARLLPAHRHYVEPFAGSLAVLLAKHPSTFETVNDLDGHLMTFWRVLRDRPDDLARVCALTPHSRAEHERSFDLDTTDEVELARRVWVRLTQGRGGTMRQTGWRFFRGPGSSGSPMSTYLAGYVNRMRSAAGRLANVSLESKPALDVIREYGAHPGVCIYADPPYLGSTRGWGNNYIVEMRGEDDHRELAEALLTCRASVVLSGYQSTLYDGLYAGWDRVEIPASTGNGGDNRSRVEVLWSNRRVSQPDLFDAVLA